MNTLWKGPESTQLSLMSLTSNAKSRYICANKRAGQPCARTMALCVAAYLQHILQHALRHVLSAGRTLTSGTLGRLQLQDGMEDGIGGLGAEAHLRVRVQAECEGRLFQARIHILEQLVQRERGGGRCTVGDVASLRTSARARTAGRDQAVSRASVVARGTEAAHPWL